ncbi:MAG: zinc ribbon domain-containing protein [Anaerolineales bacterium]|jgi:rubrerythrin|uniref:zinc ribbon domain-containing protein n=1 Tax=Candidatus Villigracilis vicinus TaxID=3140679 RepID=UPI003136AA33|nr:zinc ribbon domain-containing protein [Anaerolineales bacterium]MBK9778460.1 zinc ribbon domain-containing protein [Anaerolineales bacterium]
MELGSIFLILAVLVIVGMYLYAPFMTRARKTSTNQTHEVSALKAERDRVINALQELDFDQKLGKIPVEDYPEQRAELLKKGSEILRQLDELEPILSSARDAESRIEKAAAAKRADASSNASELSDEELEAMIAARRKQHKSKSAGFCPSCGKPVLVADHFCPSCGKSLK